MRDYSRAETGREGRELMLWKAYSCEELWDLAAGKIQKAMELLALTTKNP